MRKSSAHVYRCPVTLQALTVDVFEGDETDIISGSLVTAEGEHRYAVENGIPDFVCPRVLKKEDREARDLYERVADEYDEYIPLTFLTFNEDESDVRTALVEKLELRRSSRVLEVGCGTGRDSRIIADRLGSEGELFLQDLTQTVLEKCRNSPLTRADVPVDWSLANASHLPFADAYFDACFHFGGLNTFADIGRALDEMTRVTKVGGKVVVGDEGIAPWLRETEFAKILINYNSHFESTPPLEHLPVRASNPRLEWIMGDAFYVLDYVVSEGEPGANFDFEIPGVRGGTHRTRYYGLLEGVTAEAKRLAQRAREKRGVSMHEWLDAVVREAAMRDLGD